MSKTGIVYIMTNKSRTTIYIGVTSNLCQRIKEHKLHLNKNAFTARYNVEYCIYYEEYPSMELAIRREKELKKWRRDKKESLINLHNPEWKVLATEDGFLRKTIPFERQVDNLVKELQAKSIIDPFPEINQEKLDYNDPSFRL